MESFKIKYKLIKKFQKNAFIKIIHVFPKHWLDALFVFYGRERKMKLENFWETHVNSKKTVAIILQNFADVKLELQMSIYNKEFVNFEEVDISQFNKEELVQKMNSYASLLEKHFKTYKKENHVL
jgi:hypothetical protein